MPTHPLFEAILQRAELNTRIRKLQDEVVRYEKMANSRLYEALPDDGTRFFVDTNGFIQDIVSRGSCAAHVIAGYEEVPASAELVRIIEQMRTAWRGVVNVAFTTSGDGFHIVCTPLIP